MEQYTIEQLLMEAVRRVIDAKSVTSLKPASCENRTLVNFVSHSGNKYEWQMTLHEVADLGRRIDRSGSNPLKLMRE